MKKIITLLLVAVMMFTFAFSASAADVTEGINMNFVEDENGIVTASISAVGITSLEGIKIIYTYDNTKLTLLGKDKASVTTKNYDNVVNVVAATPWKTYSLADTGSQITLSASGSEASQFLNCTSATVLMELYFKKADGVTLDSSSFTLKANKANAKSGYTYNNGSSLLFANDATKYSFTVTPYVAQGGGNTDWTETDGTTTVTVKFPTSATEKAGDVSSWTGNASTQASKKAVKFGKNETGAKMLGATVSDGKLVVNNPEYYVEYNGEKYYGLIDVEEGKSWAILIIESVSAN